jgi:hypothetical protein
MPCYRQIVRPIPVNSNSYRRLIHRPILVRDNERLNRERDEVSIKRLLLPIVIYVFKLTINLARLPGPSP